MLNCLRICIVSIAVLAASLTETTAEETGIFYQCPPDWHTYVELTEEFNSSFPQYSTREFLFVNQETNVHNCLNERFSNGYLKGLENHLSGLRQTAERLGVTFDFNCAVTQMTNQSDRFYVIWVPDYDAAHEIEDCKEAISKTLIGYVNNGTF
ncbi:hypothetical protein [Roseobacter weihaiensis]|uniref:hypothetical protein n=1 Tax=Roseobacter weihaiensis TaxID=2763262 RepID=UPI001D0BBB3A|nr:hypothetical protein [Roseobacter sp. H9]